MTEIKSGQDLNFVTALQQAVYLIRERNQLNGHNDPVFSGVSHQMVRQLPQLVETKQ
jgi:hypothetical protein